MAEARLAGSYDMSAEGRSKIEVLLLGKHWHWHHVKFFHHCRSLFLISIFPISSSLQYTAVLPFLFGWNPLLYCVPNLQPVRSYGGVPLPILNLFVFFLNRQVSDIITCNIIAHCLRCAGSPNQTI